MEKIVVAIDLRAGESKKMSFVNITLYFHPPLKTSNLFLSSTKCHCCIRSRLAEPFSKKDGPICEMCGITIGKKLSRTSCEEYIIPSPFCSCNDLESGKSIPRS